MQIPLFVIFPVYRAITRFRSRITSTEEIFPKSTISSSYSIVISMGNEEHTIKGCLNGVFAQTIMPEKIVLFVESSDRTPEIITKTLISKGYTNTDRFTYKTHLSQEDYQWDRYLITKVYIWKHQKLPPVFVFISKGDRIGKGLSINWLVKSGYVNTEYFLQLDADVVPESTLAEKLLKIITKNKKIAAVYAFSYEISERDTITSRVIADAYNIYKRMAHVIFRLSWNYWGFHYTLEGPHVML